MAKQKKKYDPAVTEFFRNNGRKGGKARAKKHSAKQLSEWAKKGGRPPSKEKETKETSDAA